MKLLTEEYREFTIEYFIDSSNNIYSFTTKDSPKTLGYAASEKIEEVREGINSKIDRYYKDQNYEKSLCENEA